MKNLKIDPIIEEVEDNSFVALKYTQFFFLFWFSGRSFKLLIPLVLNRLKNWNWNGTCSPIQAQPPDENQKSAQNQR